MLFLGLSVKALGVCKVSLDPVNQVSSVSLPLGDIYNVAATRQIVIYETCDTNYSFKITSLSGGLATTPVSFRHIEYLLKSSSTMGESTLTSSLAKSGVGSLTITRNLSEMRTSLQQSSTWTPSNYQSILTIMVPAAKRLAGSYTDDITVELVGP